MASSVQTTVTRLLGEVQRGNRAVLGELFALVYEELHARAHQQRARWHGDYTLNTTALVHEAYLKLVDQSQAQWEGRSHFLGVAAKAMRHILIDYARRRRAEKRGGDVQKLSLDEMKVGTDDLVLTQERAEALVVLDEALKRLEQESEREARVVECRFFGGMTVEETAAALGVSARTVKRDWAMAQAWLHREMQKDLGR
jgi:RNA polymerase sigma factor (TIGR02999 family)